MRRYSLLLSLTGFALLSAPLARAQDASRIIDQYVKAAGGSKNLAKVRTLLIDGTVQSGGDEKSGTFSFRVKLPNRYYTELRSGGKTEIEAYNGKSAWHQGDSGQIATLLGQSALEIEAAAEYYNSRFQGLSKQKIGAAFKGTVSVYGHETYQIELTYPTGVQWEVFFDQQSHLIVAEKANMGGVPQEIDYDDYRATNGVKVPYKVE
ncbi:MAG: hypothetical protein WBQ59_18865, partial [Candidatus Acidiferrum sp.]